MISIFGKSRGWNSTMVRAISFTLLCAALQHLYAPGTTLNGILYLIKKLLGSIRYDYLPNKPKLRNPHITKDRILYYSLEDNPNNAL